MTNATKEQLLALAERVERATGPDRELDEAIALALGWSRYAFEDENDYVERGWHKPDSNAPVSSLPRWTASLDAALSLVPEGFERNVFDARGGVQASLESASMLVHVRARTWPLAITSAALRARAHSQEVK